jgi:hypothetical protein
MDENEIREAIRLRAAERIAAADATLNAPRPPLEAREAYEAAERERLAQAGPASPWRPGSGIVRKVTTTPPPPVRYVKQASFEGYVAGLEAALATVIADLKAIDEASAARISLLDQRIAETEAKIAALEAQIEPRPPLKLVGPA